MTTCLEITCTFEYCRCKWHSMSCNLTGKKGWNAILELRHLVYMFYFRKNAEPTGYHENRQLKRIGVLLLCPKTRQCPTAGREMFGGFLGSWNNLKSFDQTFSRFTRSFKGAVLTGKLVQGYRHAYRIWYISNAIFAFIDLLAFVISFTCSAVLPLHQNS